MSRMKPTARICEWENADKGLWLVIDRNNDKKDGSAHPIEPDEVPAILEACKKYLKIE